MNKNILEVKFTFLKELKILSDRYQITYELKENIEL